MSDPRPDVATLLKACTDAGAAQAEALVTSVTTAGQVIDAQGRSRRPATHRWSCVLRVVGPKGGIGVARAAGRLSDGADALAAQALALANAADPDPDGGPPDRQDLSERGLGILDLRLPTIEEEDRVDVVESNYEGADGVAPGVVPVSFIYQELRTNRSFRSTNGVVAEEDSSSFSLTGTVRDDQTGESYTDTIDSRHFADVASVPLGVDMARRLASYRVTADLPQGDVALLLDPLAVARLLPALVPAFSAEAIDAGRSFLAGRLGETIGSSRLHLIDDPAMPGALNTRAFDDRGVAPMALPLLREGVSGSVYMGPHLARRRRHRPTGHERQDGSLWHGNLIVRSGTRSRNMLLPDLGPHVAIADFTDLSGVDLAAGTLDLPVRTMAMNGPEIVGCVGFRRLRCTIQELLSAVVDVCSDQERINDVDACTWILQGVAVE